MQTSFPGRLWGTARQPRRPQPGSLAGRTARRRPLPQQRGRAGGAGCELMTPPLAPPAWRCRFRGPESRLASSCRRGSGSRLCLRQAGCAGERRGGGPAAAVFRSPGPGPTQRCPGGAAWGGAGAAAAGPTRSGGARGSGGRAARGWGGAERTRGCGRCEISVVFWHRRTRERALVRRLLSGGGAAMGNQLAGIAPSQILSVDSYFSDIHDFEYDKSLGSTRFFKVARAKHREGLVVVKVFAIQDPTLPLTSYKQELEELKIRLHSAQNCLPFQKATLSEKAAMLFRQYVRDNLYDRISTRPFLNNIEKRWIAFQILTAVDQAHKSGVRHGDIKTENIMVTSWNWVLLTDFASFKPTYLPEDNPADFNYFFDTSRRRTCYIAPERFVDGSMFAMELENMRDPSTPLVDLANSNQRTRGELKRAMDIFSAGTWSH